MSGEIADVRLSGWAAFLRVAADGRYRAYLLSAAVSMAGQWMQRIALGWLLWEQTHSGVWLGALAVASLAPGLVFGPVGGVLADRMDRRFLVVSGEATLLVQAVLLGFVATLGLATPLLMLALVAFAGSVAALQESARSLLMQEVTPPECIATGMSLNAVAVNVTRFIGPALAGPLIALFGPGPVFWVNAASGLCFLLTVANLRDLGTVADRRQEHAGAATGVWSGFKAVGSHATIAPVLIVFAASAVLIRPFYELMPAFAEHVLAGDVKEFSQLIMAIGVGAMIGGAVTTLLAPRRPIRMFMWSSFAACVAISLFAATASLAMAVAAALLLGFCMSINAISSQLVVVMDAPSFARGRILSLWGAAIRGGPALGALAMGASFDLFGYRWPVWAGAGLCSLIIVATFLIMRRPKAPASQQIRADAADPVRVS